MPPVNAVTEPPEGLTTRPLVPTDARAVYEVMAAQETHDIGEAAIEEADIVGDWQRPSFDVSASTVGFFDADNNKEITFSSTKVERDGDDWVVTGDLSIKGETKPVTVVFEPTGSARDPFGNLRIGFEGGTSINRKDWGLTWNAALETGGVLVSEKVKLEFDVSAIRNA